MPLWATIKFCKAKGKEASGAAFEQPVNQGSQGKSKGYTAEVLGGRD